MSDNQYNIQIATDADSSSVEELAAKIQEATGNAEELTTSLSGASDAAETMSYTLSNSEGEVFEFVASAADNAADSLEGVGDAANNAGAGVNGISPEPIQETSDASKEAQDGLEGTADAADMMGGALAAIAGLGIATIMYDLADAAGGFEESWDRIALLTSGTTDNMGAVEAKWNPAINSMREATGRGAGSIRNHIQRMSEAGVKDTNAITSAFEGLAGRSYATGKDLGNMQNTLQSVIQSGRIRAQTLKQLGVNEQDVMAATGKSVKQLTEEFKTMTADQRAQVMATILNNDMAKKSNEAFMESWGYVQQQAGLAWDYLMRVVGEAVLPVLIPAMEMATSVLKGLGDWFSKLDDPTKIFIGTLIVVGGAVGILVTGILSLVAMMKLLGIYSTVVAIAKGTWAFATYVVAGAQWALNVAMSANPIGIIIIAIIALIAVLGYLYYNNETVRNGINWLWDSLKGLGDYIAGGLVAAWGIMISPIQSVVDALKMIYCIIVGCSPGIIPALMMLPGAFISTLGAIPSIVLGFVVSVVSALAQVIIRVVMFGISFHLKIIHIFLGVVNKARAYISQLPGIVWNEMINIGKKIASAAGYIFGQVQAVFGNIVNWAMKALGIASPGHIARAVFGEMDYLVAGITDAQGYANTAAAGLGDAILDGFGSPTLSVGTNITPGTASLGYDATKINDTLTLNSEDPSRQKIIQYNTINQEGIMGPKQAAEFIVKSVIEQLEQENLITGKSW